MELSSFSGFRLQDQVFFDQGLYLLLRGDSRYVVSDAYDRTVELYFVLEQLRDDELDLWVELLYLEAFQVFLFELADHISVEGDHGFEESEWDMSYSLRVTSALKSLWFM